MAKKMPKRWYASEEILATERVYVKNLKIMMDLYRKMQSNSSIDQNAVQKVFGNIEILHQINAQILDALEAELKLRGGDYCICNFASVFIKLAQFLKLYIDYINGYRDAGDILAESAKKKDGLYIECQRAFSNELKGMELSSYLIMPIQRIPRYRLLLQTLLKHTPEDYDDYNDLKSALDIVMKIADVCDKAMLPNFSVLLANIHKSLGADINLINPRRQVVSQETVKYIGNGITMSVYLLLFNDILLYYVKESETVKVKYIFELCYTNLILPFPDEKPIVTVYDDERSFSFLFPEMRELKEWIKLLYSLFQKVKKEHYRCDFCGRVHKIRAEEEIENNSSIHSSISNNNNNNILVNNNNNISDNSNNNDTMKEKNLVTPTIFTSITPEITPTPTPNNIMHSNSDVISITSPHPTSNANDTNTVTNNNNDSINDNNDDTNNNNNNSNNNTIISTNTPITSPTSMAVNSSTHSISNSPSTMSTSSINGTTTTPTPTTTTTTFHYKALKECISCHRTVCEYCSQPVNYFDLETGKQAETVKCKSCLSSTSISSPYTITSIDHENLPDYWFKATCDDDSHFYYNQFQWESTLKDPTTTLSPTENVSQETENIPFYWKVDHINNEKHTPYYYNILSKESRWEKPYMKLKPVNYVSTDMKRICLKCGTVYEDDNSWVPTCTNCKSRLPFPHHFEPK
ncbi:hypothetical protein WA158_000494 [Blastocystis sp. Blastoise]